MKKGLGILFMLNAALGLAGCSASTGFVDGTDPCDKPVVIPERWLSDVEVETLWRKDRVALLNCGDKVEVLSGRKLDRGN